MSLLIEESSPAVHTERYIGSRTSPSQKHLTKMNKSKTLRLDSPTTIEACKELGIRVDDLKQKTIEDFKDAMVEEGIVQLRFNHYMKRYNQFLKDVYARKRMLAKARHRQERLQQLQQQQGNVSGSYPGGKSHTAITQHVLPSNVMTPNMQRNMSLNSTLPAPILNSYQKTMGYLRTSHITPEVRDMYDILGNEQSFGDETAEQFDAALALEVSKFNKVKRQKQKEAKDAFEEEMKRVKMSEELKERAVKNQEREKKLVVEKKKVVEEKKKKAEEKLEQIRDAERKYQEQKMEVKEKIQKKLEEAKKKLAQELEERNRVIVENEEKMERKRKEAEEKRIQLKIEEQAKCDQLKEELFGKLTQSEEKHNNTLSEKTFKAKLQIQKIEESVKRIKEKQQIDAEAHVQNLVEKLVKKEESIKAFQQHNVQLLKKREKEIADKNKRFFGHKSEINQQYKDRMTEINERFQKVQENLEVKRKEDEKNMKLKQELTKLKIMDKQENYNRKLRQTEYERQKILDRQKYNEEKLIWLKHQKEILQQAKVEVSIQSKIEKDRIGHAIQQLSKVTSETATSSTVNDQQKKILREILRPEDYRQLEAEERRKIEEKLEAEELRKAGGLAQTSAKR